MAILDSTPVPLSATDLTQQVVYKYIAQKVSDSWGSLILFWV